MEEDQRGILQRCHGKQNFKKWVLSRNECFKKDWKMLQIEKESLDAVIVKIATTVYDRKLLPFYPFLWNDNAL